jgi:16S rRNA (guanine1207-N2)-methyltransferase
MNQQIITQNLRGFDIKFQTKAGVFSLKGLDEGTKLLIDHLQVQDGTVMADLGSGSGVLGFVLAKLNLHGHVHLLEDHLRAVELAKENVELNKLRNVEVYLSDLFSAVSDRTYHQIFSNPPQQLGNEFLEEVVEGCFNHLKPGGEVWVVVKTNLKPVMEKFLKNIFKNSKIVAHNKEYVVLIAKKS